MKVNEKFFSHFVCILLCPLYKIKKGINDLLTEQRENKDMLSGFFILLGRNLNNFLNYSKSRKHGACQGDLNWLKLI
jgi:hypothetical protein